MRAGAVAGWGSSRAHQGGLEKSLWSSRQGCLCLPAGALLFTFRSGKRAAGGWGRVAASPLTSFHLSAGCPEEADLDWQKGMRRLRECGGSPRRRSWSQGWGLLSSFEAKGRRQFPETSL